MVTQHRNLSAARREAHSSDVPESFFLNAARPGLMEPETVKSLAGTIRYSSKDNVPSKSRKNPARPDLSYVRAYIFCHYAERLTVENLAGLINVTPNHLGRLFLKTEGITVNAFIENTRLERAAALLRGTCRPVSAIALGVGFRDISYFCSRFKNAYRMTPGKYRKNA